LAATIAHKAKPYVYKTDIQEIFRAYGGIPAGIGYRRNNMSLSLKNQKIQIYNELQGKSNLFDIKTILRLPGSSTVAWLNRQL